MPRRIRTIVRRTGGELRSAVDKAALVGTVTGPSRPRMASLVASTLLVPEARRPSARSARPVRVPDHDGALYLRPRSRDVLALQFVFTEGHHLPPADLAGPVERIVVFGANIGLPMADLADRYPDARLLGVEPDADNVRVARANLAGIADRASVVEAAVWHTAETLSLGWETDAWGLSVAPAEPDGTETVVEAVAAADVVDGFADDGPVDYLLVNIEGGWHDLLAHDAGWARSVRCIKVEIQDRYDEAVALLESLGFDTTIERLPWGAFVTGIRRTTEAQAA
ncbi:MAG: hypothetical protein EKK42_33020 [Pseudonocardiaceae bacterium]|nr:MAG: hypothetical protein EKK42_33020 [Pseudonocardiaceae bacterium]